VSQCGSVFFTPCDAGDKAAKQMTWEKVPERRLLAPRVKLQDFMDALKSFKPSVARDETQKFHEWTEQYGVEGA
jgi:hypothetical protein